MDTYKNKINIEMIEDNNKFVIFSIYSIF